MQRFHEKLNKIYRKTIESSKFKIDRDRHGRKRRSSRQLVSFNKVKIMFSPPKRKEQFHIADYDREHMPIDEEFVVPLIEISALLTPCEDAEEVKNDEIEFPISSKILLRDQDDDMGKTQTLTRLRQDFGLYTNTMRDFKTTHVATPVRKIQQALYDLRRRDLKRLDSYPRDELNFAHRVALLMSSQGQQRLDNLEKMMLVSSRIAQISRALALTSRILRCKEKETREYLVQKLSRELSTKRTCSNPKFIVFEFVFNIILRKRQVEIVKDFVKSALAGHSSCRQMIMGAGKTTVVSPLIALFLAEGTCVILRVCL